MQTLHKVARIQTLLQEMQCPVLMSAVRLEEHPETEGEIKRFVDMHGSTLLPVLLPTEQRLILFTWLLERYDPEIFQTARIHSLDRTMVERMSSQHCF